MKLPLAPAITLIATLLLAVSVAAQSPATKPGKPATTTQKKKQPNQRQGGPHDSQCSATF